MHKYYEKSPKGLLKQNFLPKIVRNIKNERKYFRRVLKKLILI